MSIQEYLAVPLSILDLPPSEIVECKSGSSLSEGPRKKLKFRLVTTRSFLLPHMSEDFRFKWDTSLSPLIQSNVMPGNEFVPKQVFGRD